MANELDHLGKVGILTRLLDFDREGGFTVDGSANGGIDLDLSCAPGNPIIKNASQTYHDLQVAWNAPWDAQVAIGARNITDETGPFNGLWYGWPPIDLFLYSTEGRITYLRYKQNF